MALAEPGQDLGFLQLEVLHQLALELRPLRPQRRTVAFLRPGDQSFEQPFEVTVMLGQKISSGHDLASIVGQEQWACRSAVRCRLRGEPQSMRPRAARDAIRARSWTLWPA